MLIWVKDERLTRRNEEDTTQHCRQHSTPTKVLPSNGA